MKSRLPLIGAIVYLNIPRHCQQTSKIRFDTEQNKSYFVGKGIHAVNKNIQKFSLESSHVRFRRTSQLQTRNSCLYVGIRKQGSCPRCALTSVILGYIAAWCCRMIIIIPSCNMSGARTISFCWVIISYMFLVSFKSKMSSIECQQFSERKYNLCYGHSFAYTRLGRFV